MFGAALWHGSGDEREALRVRAGRQILGRGHDLDVDLHLDADFVEPRHAEIRWHEGILTIADLETEAGTKLNGDPITEPTILLDGDVVGIGAGPARRRDRAEVWIDEPADHPPTSSRWSGLQFASPGPRRRGGRVFVIRHHRDGALASRLPPEPQQGRLQPWMSDAEILGGAEWVDQTVSGLDDSVAAVVLLTSRALGSEYVAQQVAEAVRHGVPVVTVVVDGARPSGDLAADLRPSTSGRAVPIPDRRPVARRPGPAP